MIKIAICDDNSKHANSILTMTSEYACKHSDKSFSLHCYTKSFDLMEAFDRHGSMDIYLLDIYIDGLSGIDVAREIKSHSKECSVVFLTASSSHMLDAFALNANHYLVKPVTKDMLFEALDRCMERIIQKTESHCMLCKTSDAMERVLFDEIVFIRAERQYQHIFLKTRNLIVREGIQALFKKLSVSPRFIMPHRSFIVNMDYISRVEKQAILMKSGESLPLPKGEYQYICQQFLDYSLNDKNVNYFN